MLIQVLQDVHNPLTGEVIYKVGEEVTLEQLNKVMHLVKSINSTISSIAVINTRLCKGLISSGEALDMINSEFGLYYDHGSDIDIKKL